MCVNVVTLFCCSDFDRPNGAFVSTCVSFPWGFEHRPPHDRPVVVVAAVAVRLMIRIGRTWINNPPNGSRYYGQPPKSLKPPKSILVFFAKFRTSHP